MEGKMISAERYARLEKLEAKEEKQKRYQAILNAITNLRAKWAMMNGCPITRKHAVFYADLDEHLKKSLSVDEVMAMADSKDSATEATAHAMAELNKKGGTEVQNEYEPEDSDA